MEFAGAFGDEDQIPGLGLADDEHVAGAGGLCSSGKGGADLARCPT